MVGLLHYLMALVVVPTSSASAGRCCAVQERHRTQEQNFTDCVDKLFDCIVQAAEVDGVTSPETAKRIQHLSQHSTRTLTII